MTTLAKPGSFSLPYSAKYKKASPYDFPKFTLAKKDEKAVVMLIDPQPTCAFVHWLTIGIRVDQKTQTRSSKGGYFICLGAPEKLLQDEADIDCPYCLSAEDTDNAAIGVARFRACSHLIHYATTPQGVIAVPQGYPPQFMLKAWVFGQQNYNILADKKDRWGEHTYRHHDMLITCVSAQFQNFTVELLPSALWLEPVYTQFDAAKKPVSGLALQIRDIYQQTKLKDLTPLLGRLTSLEEAQKHVANAKRFVQELGGIETAGMTPGQVEQTINAHGAVGITPSVDIDDLFGNSEQALPSAVPSVVSTQPAVPQSVHDQQVGPTIPVVQTLPTTVPSSAVTTPSGDVDFDALLG